MKTLFLTPLCLLVFHICFAQQDSGKVTVSGIFKNNTDKNVSIVNVYEEKIFTGNIASNNEITIPLTITPGYYTIVFAEELGSLYLRPGFDVSVSIDMSQFDESIKFTGKGAPENTFLAEKYLKTESLKAANGLNESYDLSENKFLEINSALYMMKKDFLAKASSLDNQFRYMETQTIELENCKELYDFKMMKLFASGTMENQVSEKYPDPYRGLDKENEKLLGIPIYSYLIKAYIFEKVNPVMMKDNNQDFSLIALSILDTTIKNKEIKEQVGFEIVNFGMDNSKNLDMLYKTYSTNYKNERNRKRIDEKYQAMKSVVKGKPSPDINFSDINGMKYSLEDFRGQFVYIDVWATWCAPCVAEIPYLKSLGDELKEKNIAFVSICYQDKFENWTKMVKEKELSGTQLFAEEGNDSFFKKYVIRRIPRFILLDKEGNIIDPDALRPSDPKLKEHLVQLN